MKLKRSITIGHKKEEINLRKGKHKKNALIITELPYRITKAGWIEKLAELVDSGRLMESRIFAMKAIEMV